MSTDATQPTKPAKPARYRAVSAPAVACLVFGVLSSLTILDWTLAIFPLSTLVLGWQALKRIRRNPEELTGRKLAQAGLILAGVFWVAGYSWLLYSYCYDTPAGYKAVPYKVLLSDASMKEQKVPPEAHDLDKQKIYIKGYMYPGSQNTGIRQFLLVNDNGACAFCAPKPKPTQLILVKLANGMRTEYTTRLIGVGGEFKVHTDTQEQFGGIFYELEADCLR
jgi:hypothetical protein